jgi:inner membrane protease subunit 1
MAFRPFRWIKPIIFSPPFRVLTATAKTFFLGHLIWQYGFAQGATRGASMLPTFEVLGDSVIVSKQYRRGRNIKVGDVVQFDSVAEPRESVIKRVIGLEGDYVLRNSPGSRYDDMIQVSCV